MQFACKGFGRKLVTVVILKEQNILWVLLATTSEVILVRNFNINFLQRLQNINSFCHKIKCLIQTLNVFNTAL